MSESSIQMPGWGREIALAAAILILGAVLDTSGAAASETGQSRVVLVLGDSLAAGYGLDPAEAFPALLQQKMDAEGWKYRVINGGLSGDTSAGGLRRIDWLLKRKADVLIVELGGNDGLRGIAPDATEANLRGIIERARKKYPSIKVVIAGMRMPPNMGAAYVDQFENLFSTVAESTNSELIPFLLEGVGGNAALNQEDRIHPTAEGQRIVAENVWRVLKPLLESIGAGS